MGATRDLAQFVVETRQLPANILHEAKRDVINIIGVALYAASDPSLQILLNLFREEGGKARATVWGTRIRTTLQNAALANGYTAHLEDYDDTHFPTVIHPSAPTVPPALAVAEAHGLSGRDLLTAVGLGIEVCCRVGMAVYPWHYDEGWHITGTTGVFGAAAAAGKLLGLDVAQMTAALGTAGTQAAGVREVFGSMAKPMHPGRSGQSGLLAALLSQKGFTSTEQILEGRRGFAAVYSGQHDLAKATGRLGSHWELLKNGLKPYACGVVNHPLIDACRMLRQREGVTPQRIQAIQARVHPLVLELVNRPDPKVGLEGKFSVQHCVAVGLVDGAAYPAQFTDEKVRDPLIAGLRARVELARDDTMQEDEAVVRVVLADGRTLEEHVRHATGAPENPMSDDMLNEKFRTLAGRTLSRQKVRRLLDALWGLEEVASVRDLARLLRPGR